MTRQSQMPNAKAAEIVRDPTTAEAARPLRLLIVAGNLALLRGHYEGVIARLVQDGVAVSVRYLRDTALGVEEYRDTLRKAGIEIAVAAVPRHRRGPADLFALRLREVGNILRFSHPDYTGRTCSASAPSRRRARAPSGGAAGSGGSAQGERRSWLGCWRGSSRRCLRLLPPPRWSRTSGPMRSPSLP